MLLLLAAARADVPVKQYFFSHFTSVNGLLSNRAQSITQDSEGFLWIGTVNGLQRFDGHRFVNFRHDPKNGYSIPGNDVWQVFFDSKKRLWLLFTNGDAGIFDTRTFRFSQVKLELSDERFRPAQKKLFEDSKGNLVLLLPNITMLTFSERANTFSSKHNFIEVPQGWRPWEVREEPGSGRYWLVADSGLAVYNTRTKKLSYSNHNTENEPAIELYKHLRHLGVAYIDSKKRLWFQSWLNAGAPSFYCYDLQKQQPIINDLYIGSVLGRYSEPKKFIEQSDGRLLLTGTPMLAEFLEDQQKFIAIRSSLTINLSTEYNYIMDSYVDKEQNIWLCTRNEGIFKFNPSTELFASIPHRNPRTGLPVQYGMLSFVQLKDGTMLTSAWGEGIVRYDSNLNKLPLNISPIAEDNLITAWSMHQRNDGKVWLGLQDEGGNIMVYEQKAGKAIQYKVFYHVTVRQLVEDRQGNMWVGTQNRGLFKWTASKGAKKFEDGFTRFEHIGNTQIKKLLIDNSGFLWVATIADGVYKIDPVTDKVLEHLTDKSKPGLPAKGTSTLMQYNDTLILIANNGLVVYNTKTKTTANILPSNVLPSGYAESMLKDQAGYVWLGLVNGLCRVNVFKKTFNYYDREDGMVNDNFMTDAVYPLRDGRLLFGTNKDFIVFRPQNIVHGETPPDVRITQFHLANKVLRLDSLLQADAVHLTHDNNSISIDFSSLTYLQKNKLNYYYMLEGVDRDWVKADNVKRASYPYLAPGRYTFKVRAENTGGLWSRNTTLLKINVSPPFWQTWWFYSLLILIAASLLFTLDRERMKRKAAIQKMRSDIAGNLHQEINVALNNINILSEMARLKADKEPQKSKEFIEQIHSKSHNMIIAMDDMLWSIDPGNDNMAKTVLRMKEYIDALNNRHGANIEMLIDEKVNELRLGMQFRHEAFILFKESIRGLIKARASDCRIHVSVEKSELVYTVEFKNHSCDMQQFRHLLERQDIKQRLSFLEASSQVQIHKESSVFELALPIR